MAATAAARQARTAMTEAPGWELSEVASRLGVKPHVLRYWEGEFPALRVDAGTAAQRRYGAEEVELFRQIKHLLHTERLTIAGARRRLGLLRGADRRPALRREGGGALATTAGRTALVAIRDELEELRRLLG